MDISLLLSPPLCCCCLRKCHLQPLSYPLQETGPHPRHCPSSTPAPHPIHHRALCALPPNHPRPHPPLHSNLKSPRGVFSGLLTEVQRCDPTCPTHWLIAQFQGGRPGRGCLEPWAAAPQDHEASWETAGQGAGARAARCRHAHGVLRTSPRRLSPGPGPSTPHHPDALRAAPGPAAHLQTHLDISRCSQTEALFFEVHHFKTLNRGSIFRGPFH